MTFVPVPAVIVPPPETLQAYPVIPLSVVYVLPEELTQAVAGPVIVGTGNCETVTLFICGVLEPHELLAVTEILPPLDPAVALIDVELEEPFQVPGKTQV